MLNLFHNLTFFSKNVKFFPKIKVFSKIMQVSSKLSIFILKTQILFKYYHFFLNLKLHYRRSFFWELSSEGDQRVGRYVSSFFQYYSLFCIDSYGIITRRYKTPGGFSKTRRIPHVNLNVEVEY